MATETRILTRTVIESYKNSKYQLTTDLSRIYTSPSNTKSSIILLIQIANIDPLNSSQVTISWRDFSDGDSLTYLLYQGNIPARSALSVIDSKLILEPSDSIWALASENNKLHATLSILEIT